MTASAAEMAPTTLLLQRRAEAGGDRVVEDSYRISLAINGGGMAGVVPLGMVHVLESEGLLSHIDEIAGISAGALIGAAALTGQLDACRQILIHDLNDEGFIRHRRAALGKPIMDLGVLGRLVSEVHAFPSDELVNHDKTLTIGLTELPEYTATSVTNHDMSAHEVTGYMLDAVTVPRAAGKPEHFADGGIAWPSTHDLAAQNDPTHILVTDVIGSWLDKQGVEGGTERFRQFSRTQAELINRMQATHDPAHQTVYPSPGGNLPNIMTRNPGRLLAGYYAGQDAMWAALQSPANGPLRLLPPKRSIVMDVASSVAGLAAAASLRRSRITSTTERPQVT